MNIIIPSELNLAVINPAEGRKLGLLLGLGLLRPLLQLPEPWPQRAHELLRAPPFPGQPGEVLDPPPADEELEDVGVVPCRVHPEALRDGAEAREEVVVAAVVHEVRRHGHLLAHHVGEGAHGVVRVDLEELVDDARVRRLVPLLVGGDGAADLRQLGVAVPFGEARRVAVRDEGGALLERRVDEPLVRVRLRLGVLMQTLYNSRNTEKNQKQIYIYIAIFLLRTACSTRTIPDAMRY
jgi:hypothetical protein